MKLGWRDYLLMSVVSVVVCGGILGIGYAALRLWFA